MTPCECGHAFDRHDGIKTPTHDACAGGTPGFCGCPGYVSAAKESPENYCGCCGCEIDGADANWCLRCVQHVGRFTSAHLWDLTYFALNGVECPFQVGREVIR